MANEVFWSAVETDSGRQLLLSEILLAAGDTAMVENHPAIMDAIDVTGTQSDSADIREDDINGATLLATIAENGSWSNTAWTDTKYSVAVAHYFQQYTISDLLSMVQDGQFDPARFARAYKIAESMTWCNLLAVTGATFTQTLSDTGAAPNLDDLYTANYVLETQYGADGPKMAILHPKQAYNLSLDAEFTQAHNASVNDPEALALARAAGGTYVGRYRGIDVYKSFKVPTAGGKHQGCIFTRGAIAKAVGTPQGDGGYARAVTLGRLRFAQERDPTGPRYALRGETFLGAAKFQDFRGGLFKSPV